uniref:Telomerase associated protein 1 n=2 Tax=Gasterosteus aculeatus TaxID=69293 RepID=A0AAQ4RWD7_GASAC|nr:telomerase protein component 1 isoform X1 [Gasterosteus aculeatus aculeatus]
MRALCLQKANVAQADQPRVTCGRRLSSDYAPLCLENKLLAQSSTLMPQPGYSAPASSLQPSRLSSTSSSLLAASLTPPCRPSPLLSTENRLLTDLSPGFSFSLASSASVPNDPPLFTSLAGGSLLERFAGAPPFLHHAVGGEQKSHGGGDEGGNEVMQCSFEETSVQYSEEEDILPEDEEEEEDDDALVAMELPAQESGNEELEQTTFIKQEEFAEIDRANENIEEELQDKKYLLLNAVCCSLVNKSTAPGQKDWDSEKSVWTKVIRLSRDISVRDPQFLLKVAVYTRQELNIRITANFLLALAANLPSTKPHVRRYFCAAVQLPSDWLEVVRIYSACFSRSLPSCLKKAMADKFKQFNEYQLAKYNTRKHRCKHSRNRPKSKKPSDEQMRKWANLLRSDESILKKFLKEDGSRAVVDKKQKEFSMKKMIEKFHIKEPAEHVMAILGKKYPADPKTFTRSGIKGSWDRERAGQRMKLKEPETWERLLSQEGNKAATWEKLIDNKSLPFMAMLRNLRNMITKGISEAHHKKILSRLTNKKAVVQSRQFPTRFLAAYKVIMELNALALQASKQALPPVQEILKGILGKIPKSRRFKSLDWETTPRSRIRVTMGVPFIYRLYKAKKTQLMNANKQEFTVALLDRYRGALETAVQLSCRYNVPPLPGRTVVVLACEMDSKDPCQKVDFCLPPEPGQKNEEEEEEESGTKPDDNPTVSEAVALLSLMIASSAEDCQLCLHSWRNSEEVKLESDVLLDNVRSLLKQMKAFSEMPYEARRCHCLTTMLSRSNKVDNIVVLTDRWLSLEIQWAVETYRTDVNDKALMVQIHMEDGESELVDDRNCVKLYGFSDQILRFVAERGSSRLLDHVEHLDKVYNIPPPEGARAPETTNCVAPIPASPKLRWRSVRVFVSSTFRDMHAERDVLVRAVFPELRRRAASRRLHLQEVELRWGVTEEESGRAAELCLSEVCRSQMLVGILGERYGLVPPRPLLPDLPQHSWLASAPAGLSITEMEIRQFQALYPDTAQQRMFCYFRDPNITNAVPVAWRSDFASESKEAESKMASLKRRIRASDVKVTENYCCEWGGAVEGKPYLKHLEVFGEAVLEDLWAAVETLFVEEEDEASSDATEQEVHQEALRRQFSSRAKLLSGAVEVAEQARSKGGLMVVEAGPGEGKTVFMAALADGLRNGVKSRTNLACDIIAYSTAASQSARSVENLLRFLVRRLRRMNDTKEASPLPRSYKDLLLEFHSFLSGVKREKAVVLLIDGVDLLQDGRGQLNSDWIPQQLPQGVCLVLSITSKAPLLQTLAEKRGAVLLALGPLTVLDRKEMVKKELDSFGKKLSDSAFNNQLQTLVMKKGAASPLYLHLACEDLRNFASFDKLKESLQDLPQSLSQLVHRSLARLCTRFRGERGLRWALAALAVSSTGLRERDLYSVLNTCSDLSSRDGRLAWQDVLRLSRKPEGRLPMATFTRIAQSLQSLIGPSQCRDTDDLLALTNPEVRRAFEDFLLPTESDRTRAHLVLAAHLWALADPQGTDTFLLCEANSVMQLPANLNRSGQVEALHSLLSSYYFLYANVRHGLLHHLREAYSLCDGENPSAASLGFQDRLEDCRRFLRRHAPLLSSWPALFLQQALNEPPETAAHIWARGLTGRGGPRVVEWLNNDAGGILQETNELVSTFSSVPTCLVGSSDGELMVVGTGRGMLHLISTRTGHEVKSLVSSCDGISSCVLLKDGRLATTSFDGRIEIWDIANGCRTALIQGHANVITGSDLTADRKHLVTVSLDFMLKVWSSAKGHEVAALPSSSPLNCVTFDPEGHLLAAGCWNGNVIVWNWLQNRTLASLTGHRRSVRSVSFSPSSSMLCSGSISGEVRLWSVPSSTCVGCFQAHRGAAEALAFLDGGSTLLTAGSDHLLQLWSGGLGRSVAALKSDDGDPEPPLQKLKSATSEPAALCVAVNGDCAAVGYHGDGIKLFSLDSGKKTWDSGGLDVSTLSLLWVARDAEHSQPELLLSAGSDKRVRVWRRADEDAGLLAGLEEWGTFNVQPGAVQAMAQNATYLATASDESSIVLCSLRDLALGPSLQPHALLSGHSGAVTCLAFSPDGGQLLSGGKDKALLVWDVSSSPAVLSKSLLHCHKDWITSCAWTPDCAISSSSDGALCSWDLQAGRCLREINLRDPLASICCLGGYVVAGGAGGTLHVWNWETNVEICHVAAHEQSIHHCSLLPRADQGKKVKPEEMTVFTASEDGSVQLWKPLQVEHFGTLQGHSGAICGVVLAEGLPEFLSVSEDRSLRRWKRTTERPGGLRGPVAALCFSRGGDLLLAGYESGLLEVWRRGAAVGRKQVSDGTLTAICSMPGERFAVSYEKLAVDVWKVVWDGQRRLASLVKVSTYAVEAPVIRLNYCSVLMGVSDTGTIFDVTKDSASYGSYSVLNWNQQCRILGTTQNDERSMWLLAHAEGQIRIGFIFAMGPKIGFQSAFGSINLEIEEEEEEEEEEAGKVEVEAGTAEEEKGSLPTAGSVDKEFVVCGDANGNMWFNEPPDVCSWSSRKPAHSDRISVLKLTERLIISASHDGTVKLWDRNTKKQVGMFACGGPVLHLEVNPVNPNELVCGDGQGKIYFLSWKE